MVKLTHREELAVLKYQECGNKSEAYRHAYSCEGMQPQSIYVEASRLFSKEKVRAMIEDLQKKARNRNNVTIESLTAELERARITAMKNGQAGAAVSAVMAKAKLHGLIPNNKLHVTTSRNYAISDAPLAGDKLTDLLP